MIVSTSARCCDSVAIVVASSASTHGASSGSLSTRFSNSSINWA